MQVLDQSITAKIENAEEYIRRFRGAVIALSAGVDSSLVAYLAKRSLGERVIAVTGVSESLSPQELKSARVTARQIGIRHRTVETDELTNPDYVSNSGDRCYHCKSTLYRELRIIASDLGYEAILDGTQTDDMSGYRPGLRAGLEAGVSSPLLHAGFTKTEVRAAARSLGLSVWNKPAMPCLSSRVQVGQIVTPEKLRMIDEAEAYVKSLLPITDLRIRHNDKIARIEVEPGERHLFFNEELMSKIDRQLRSIGFTSVTLDLGGYKTQDGRSHSGTLPML